ncbi:MAG: DUF3137 domain-containing protein [Alphaproteobacteria bacterium]
MSDTHADTIRSAVDEEIRPILAGIELSRRGYLQLTKLVATGIFGFFGVIALILWGLISIWVALPVLGFAAIVAGLVAWAMARMYRGTTLAQIVPPLAEAIGGMTYRPMAEGFNAAAVIDLGILPSSQAVAAEHLLEGMHRGTGFRMAELSCYDRVEQISMATRRKRSRRRRNWRGLVIEVDVPVRFDGPVILARDRGLAGRIHGAGLRRVDLPDPAFARIFEVYAADTDEAARLVTPALAQSLAALSQARPGKALAAAFASGVFVLTIPLPRGFLEQGSLFQPAHRLLDKVPQIVRELTLPHRVIDYLMGDRPGPLL